MRLAVNGGQPLFTLGLLMFALSLVDFLSLLWSPSTKIEIFFVKSIIWRTHTNTKKKSCWFKIWMGFVWPILIKLGTSSIWDFLNLPVWCPLGSYVYMLVTTQWPLKRAAHLISLVWFCLLWSSESLMELSALYIRSVRFSHFFSKLSPLKGL